ncbi:hypothetical protein ABLE91_22155 [Aquabacter sp. CN5-332]|uniref:hypothetical protein n=1 Tax=Aquabacter sp. CN5-332 TaxID=3156608 RepID=UPI0032B5842D
MRISRGVLALVLCMLASALSGATAARAETAGRVYLMRGIANFFSYGLDDLAKRLAAAGIAAEVHQFGEWQGLARDAVSWSRAHRGAPVVVIGHSLGADAAVHMAQRMTALGASPALVITFDPVGLSVVEETGGRFINYFQSDNGYGRALEAGAGFTGTIENLDLAGVPGINHFNLEKSRMLHAEVVEALSALMRRAPAPVPVPFPEARPKAAKPPAMAARPASRPAPGRQASAGAPAFPQGYATWGVIRRTGAFE